MIVAIVRRPGSTTTLVSTGINPWRIATTDKMHVYSIQDIVTDAVKDVHVVRLHFYVSKDLETTAASKGVFQHAFTESEFEMAGIVDVSDAKGQGFDVKMDWVGFNEGESSWKPLAVI